MANKEGLKDNDILGSKIVDVRPMTKAEMKKEFWDSDEIPTAIVLESGVILYPSQDSEGNGPGCMFGRKGTYQFGI